MTNFVKILTNFVIAIEKMFLCSILKMLVMMNFSLYRYLYFIIWSLNMKIFFEILFFLIELFIDVGLVVMWVNMEYISQWKGNKK